MPHPLLYYPKAKHLKLVFQYVDIISEFLKSVCMLWRKIILVRGTIHEYQHSLLRLLCNSLLTWDLKAKKQHICFNSALSPSQDSLISET